MDKKLLPQKSGDVRSSPRHLHAWRGTYTLAPHIKYENSAGVVKTIQASIRQIQVSRQAKFGAEAVEGQTGGSGRGKVLYHSRKS